MITIISLNPQSFQPLDCSSSLINFIYSNVTRTKETWFYVSGYAVGEEKNLLPHKNENWLSLADSDDTHTHTVVSLASKINERKKNKIQRIAGESYRVLCVVHLIIIFEQRILYSTMMRFFSESASPPETHVSRVRNCYFLLRCNWRKH